MGRIRYISPSFTPEAKEAQSALYPAIERGLRGEGLTPGIDETTRQRMLARTDEKFLESGRGLESFMHRTIPMGDVKVRQYLKNALMSQFARQKESIGREFEFRGFEDIEPSQNLAFGSLGAEKGVATSMANIGTQSALRRAYAPDFQSELFGGLGGATGMYLASGFGQRNQTNISNPQSSDSRLAWSGYQSNFSSADFTTPAPIHYANRFASSYPR